MRFCGRMIELFTATSGFSLTLDATTTINERLLRRRRTAMATRKITDSV
jgi:hypothetical protein